VAFIFFLYQLRETVLYPAGCDINFRPLIRLHGCTAYLRRQSESVVTPETHYSQLIEVAVMRAYRPTLLTRQEMARGPRGI